MAAGEQLRVWRDSPRYKKGSQNCRVSMPLRSHGEENRSNSAPNLRVVLVAGLTETGAATVELEMKNESKGVLTSEKSAKTAAELESMIMAELREYPECESAAVAVIGPTSVDPWDTVLIREGAQIADECEARLAEITSRLREEFDLAQ